MYSGIYSNGLKNFHLDNYLPEYSFYTKNDRIFRFLRDKILGHQRYCLIMDEMIGKSGVDIADFVKKLWLNDDCLRNLNAENHCVGLHSYSHPTQMATLPRDAQHEEYSKNFDHLQRLLGNMPTTMAHPCNSYTPDTLEILGNLGTVVGFTTIAASGLRHSMLEWPREDHANVMVQMAN